jgi:hypothetical protein
MINSEEIYLPLFLFARTPSFVKTVIGTFKYFILFPIGMKKYFLILIVALVLLGCQNKNIVDLNESSDLGEEPLYEPLVPLNSDLEIVITPVVFSYNLKETQFESRNISVKYADYDKVSVSWEGRARRLGSTDYEILTLKGSNSFSNIKSGSFGLLPTFWEEQKSSSSSGIWISRKLFKNLKLKGKADWRFEFRKEAPDWFLRDYGAYVVSAYEQGNLTKDMATTYPVLLDSVATDLPAIRAEDGVGNVYYILDDYGNPLVLEFIYNPIIAINTNSSLMLKALLSYQVIEIKTE